MSVKYELLNIIFSTKDSNTLSNNTNQQQQRFIGTYQLHDFDIECWTLYVNT